MPAIISTLFYLLLVVSAFSATALSAKEHAGVNITITTAGYAPAEVTIKPNTEVVFVNAGTEDYWPATDNHPTHTLYDGTNLEEHCSQDNYETFDACQAIKPEERWSFVFQKPGDFSYHDHLWPHLKGRIIVSDTELEAPTPSYLERFVLFSQNLFTLITRTFLGADTTETSRKKSLDLYVQRVIDNDPRWAIEALRADAASSSELFARCHEVLHDIGKEAFHQYGSFGAASVFQSDFCNSGYIHGVFEAHFSITGDPTLGLVEACEQYAAVGGRPFDLWQCHHGVGHGFMYFTGGDVLPSLELCSETFQNEAAIGDCHNGVYMELFNNEVLAKEADYLQPDEPATTCKPMGLSQGDCYHYLPTYLMQTLKLTTAEMFTVCDSSIEKHRDSCKLGIGAEMMKRLMGEPQSVFLSCGDLRSFRDQIVCVAGAVSMYVNQTASIPESYALCDKIPAVYQQACLEVVDGRVSDFMTAT